jgi:hypothetical protein
VDQEAAAIILEDELAAPSDAPNESGIDARTSGERATETAS